MRGKEGRRQYDKRATPYAPKEPTRFARSNRVVNEWLRLLNFRRFPFRFQTLTLPRLLNALEILPAAINFIYNPIQEKPCGSGGPWSATKHYPPFYPLVYC